VRAGVHLDVGVAVGDQGLEVGLLVAGDEAERAQAPRSTSTSMSLEKTPTMGAVLYVQASVCMYALRWSTNTSLLLGPPMIASIVGINEWALAHSKINSLENHKSPPHGMACMWSLVPPCLF
jgi:hypothetical protein